VLLLLPEYDWLQVRRSNRTAGALQVRPAMGRGDGAWETARLRAGVQAPL